MCYEGVRTGAVCALYGIGGCGGAGWHSVAARKRMTLTIILFGIVNHLRCRSELFSFYFFYFFIVFNFFLFGLVVVAHISFITKLLFNFTSAPFRWLNVIF